MKKILLVFMWLCSFFLCMQVASADKARSITTSAQSAYHEQHLLQHLDASDCFATGNYIKIRSDEDRDDVIGHLEQADLFQLLKVQAGYALIQITDAHETSPDSYQGLTGWVDADYIDCTCSEQAYRSAAGFSEQNDLTKCIGTTLVVCTGNNLRVRNAPNGENILGHLEKADEFMLLAVNDGWAKIQVTCAAETSPDSWDGLVGWVSTDYLRAKENSPLPEAALSGSLGEYGEILEAFYQAVVEGWDDVKLAEADFVEPYDLPASLEDDGFILMDLNDDGMDELIILSADYLRHSKETYLTAIYALVDGKPMRVLESWTRNRHYLCADGSIYNEGSNGAAYSVYYIFDWDGREFVVREGVLSGDYEDHGETKYGWFLVDERADFSYAEHQLISDEEAMQRVEAYQQCIDFDLEGFTTFEQYANMRGNLGR